MIRCTLTLLAAGLVVALFPMSVSAQEKGQVPEHPGLERLKALAGSWQMVIDEKDGKGIEAHVQYRVSAMGSAVVETLFPGTEHEMVTIYHLDGEQLMLTHYCAMGNQPRMKQVETDRANVLKFAFAGGTSLEPGVARMSGLTMTFLDDGKVKCDWVVSDGSDKEMGRKVFVIERAGSADGGAAK